MTHLNSGLFTSASQHWATPKDLYADLDKEFHFSDDPCPLTENSIEGLLREWGTSTFLNPPYGRDIGKWIDKARNEAQSGKTVVCLLPARTDTRWFHEHCLKAKEIRFLRGRLKFGGAEGNAPFPSMIVVFESKMLKFLRG